MKVCPHLLGLMPIIQSSAMVEFLLHLKPYAERDSASEVITRLRGEFEQVKGIQVLDAACTGIKY